MRSRKGCPSFQSFALMLFNLNRISSHFQVTLDAKTHGKKKMAKLRAKVTNWNVVCAPRNFRSRTLWSARSQRQILQSNIHQTLPNELETMESKFGKLSQVDHTNSDVWRWCHWDLRDSWHIFPGDTRRLNYVTHMLAVQTRCYKWMPSSKQSKQPIRTFQKASFC